MDVLKRYLKISDGSDIIALAVFFRERGRSRIKLTTEKRVRFVLFSDGISIRKYAFNEVIDLDLDVSDDLYVALILDDEKYFAHVGDRFLSAGEIIEEYEKIQTQKTFRPATEDTAFLGYDDEKIAEKNYYLLGFDDEKTNDLSDAYIKAENNGKRSRVESRTGSFKDDAVDFACQNKDDGFADSGERGKQREETFYERRDKQRRKSDLENLLSSRPKENNLCKIFPFGNFCVTESNSGEKIVVGRLFARGSTYYCVARRGKKDSPDLLSPTVFFVPENGVSGENGYLMSFISEDGEDYIEKQNGL